MPRPATIAALVLAAAAFSGAFLATTAPAAAGGEVIDQTPRRHHHHRHVARHYGLPTYISRGDGYYAGARTAAVIDGPHYTAFHGAYVGGNYAYHTATSIPGDIGPGFGYDHAVPMDGEIVTFDDPPAVGPRPVDPRAVVGPPSGGYYDVAVRGDSHQIVETVTEVAPSTKRGMVYETRTRPRYVFSYDTESENPRCWQRQSVAGQARKVWACPGR